MNDYINILIDSYNLPILTAFLLGILTSVSPCPLATNITAIAYITKHLQSVKKTIVHGFTYALGRMTSYVGIALLIKYGFSSFQIASIFQGWWDKILWPILIIIGLVMFDIIKFPSFSSGGSKFESFKNWLGSKWYIGTFLLGMLFALAFCPYSGVLFFGILIPLIIKSTEGVSLSLLFGLGTSIPVIVFTFLIALSIWKLGKTFQVIGKMEKWLRYIVASVFILVWLYYTSITIQWLYAIL